MNNFIKELLKDKRTNKEIIVDNIKQSLDELENRIKMARFNIERYKNNNKIICLTVRNVCYASTGLEKDLEELNKY